MSETNPLFRKAALEKLSSPERLDVAMEVTSAKGWVALLTIAVVLAGVVVWSVVGSMPKRVDGKGILIGGGGLREIRAEGDGSLVKFELRVNDTVTVNQVVGEIAQLDAEGQLRAANEAAALARSAAEIGSAEDNSTIQQNRAQIAGLQGNIGMLQSQIESTESDLTNRRDMLAKGLTTASRVQQIEQQLISLRSQITGVRGQIAALNGSNAAIQQRIRSRADTASRAATERERVGNVTTQTARITSGFAGRVIELKKSRGDRVRPGEVLAIVEPVSDTAEPIVFVDLASGKLIRPGMEAQVSPSTVKREEYGFMRGTIRSVSDFAVSPDAVKATVANPQLVDDMLKGGSKLEIRVALEPDPNTTSKWAWSSSQGPPVRIDTGTELALSVVVERKRPIELVIPALKRMFGWT